ncbi:MAG: ASCH domain-containing protein [Candidatus Brocadiia bacterium]
MKALSIRQPWAWLILHGGKRIENREWSTNFRGCFLIHASKGMTPGEYEDAEWSAEWNDVKLPPFETLQRGGIVGMAKLVDCVTESDSPWFVGRCGFVLDEVKPLPFRSYRGALGFFDVPNADGSSEPAQPADARPHEPIESEVS